MSESKHTKPSAVKVRGDHRQAAGTILVRSLGLALGHPLRERVPGQEIAGIIADGEASGLSNAEIGAGLVDWLVERLSPAKAVLPESVLEVLEVWRPATVEGGRVPLSDGVTERRIEAESSSQAEGEPFAQDLLPGSVVVMLAGLVAGLGREGRDGAFARVVGALPTVEHRRTALEVIGALEEGRRVSIGEESSVGVRGDAFDVEESFTGPPAPEVVSVLTSSKEVAMDRVLDVLRDSGVLPSAEDGGAS